MEQLVDYLNFGQEKAQVPDREAKLIHNLPFMTQLDFFDMQEDQEMKWEDETTSPSGEGSTNVWYVCCSRSGNGASDR